MPSATPIPDSRPVHWTDYRPGRFAVVGALVTLMLLARVPRLWLTGEFVAEDAWVFFAGAFNTSWTGSLLQPYAGYFHFAPRLLAEIWSLLPLVWQPYAYAGSGLLIDAALLSLFCLPHFRPVVASDAMRLAVVALLALAQNAENLGLLLGLHWYLSFGLALLLVMSPPVSWTGRVAMTLGAVVTVWSAPAVLVLAPWLVWGVWRGEPGFRRNWCAIVLANLVVVAALVGLLRLGASSRTGEFTIAEGLIAAERFYVRGWLGSGLLGEPLARSLAETNGVLPAVFAVLIGGAVSWILWQRRAEPTIRRVTALLVMGGLMIAPALTRTLYLPGAVDATLPLHERYLTAPTLLLLVALFALIGRVAGARLFVAIWAVECALLVAGLPRLNHWARPALAFHLRDFAEDIEQFERECVARGEPGSLYVPMDVPYWGPVLESAGGVRRGAEADPLEALRSMVGGRDREHSWLETVRRSDRPGWIEHELLGPLRFEGEEAGRLWFRDADGRELFTARLLDFRFWRIEDGGFRLTPAMD